MRLTCAPPGQPETAIRIEVDARHELGQRPTDGRFTLFDNRVATAHPTAVPADGARLGVDGGEAVKSFETLERVTRALANGEIGRGDALCAIGGGTVGDLGGMAASLWLRGIAFEQVPTTLLSMVDSSVGGKTAINIEEGKNLVGTFWPARTVLIDPGFLTTLSDDEYASGLGEVLKVAIGLDAEMFALCEQHAAAVVARDPGALATIIERALRAKIDVVESDFREAGRRRLLNLGHTLGHALEAESAYTKPHGVMVARGIHYVIDLATRRDALADDTASRMRTLLEAYGFATTPLPDAARLRDFLRRDKKRAGDSIHAVLPTGIGASEVVEMGWDEFEQAL